ncbi:hypothetical protein D7252_06500 [Microbacterium sp. CGR2]|nr:hypothetical protein D7252_06500 [Microbacterium sp. CGR2]
MPADSFERVLATLGLDADHRDAERSFREAGWQPCGAGDWAIALRSPDGAVVSRISPFDPTGPYAAQLYRDAAATRQVPTLFAHRRLAGGGDLQVLEWLRPAEESDAAAFHAAIAARAPEVAELTDIIRRIHARAQAELPWCGPLDENPSNVMRGGDDRLVVIDPYYADGPSLYGMAESDPDAVAARIPSDQRRFLTEIPLTYSGPWPEESREKMRRGLEAADARRAR